MFVRILVFAYALSAAPLALAQSGSFANGQTLWNANGCEGCHEYLTATGVQAVRDQIAQRLTPVTGLNFAKASLALIAALSGIDLDNDETGMDGIFPAGTFSAAQVADLATYISNMPNPAPVLSYTPFPGPVFPATAAGAVASQTITVTNSGTSPLTFAVSGAAQIASGPHAADYSVTDAQCQGVTLQPAVGSCTVILQFRPVAGADLSRTASLALLMATSATPLLVPMVGSLSVPAAAAPPTGTPPATTPAPGNSANSPAGAGAVPWQLLGLLVLASIPGIRRQSR